MQRNTEHLAYHQSASQNSPIFFSLQFSLSFTSEAARSRRSQNTCSHKDKLAAAFIKRAPGACPGAWARAVAVRTDTTGPHPLPLFGLA